jgi:endonuclease/exonuclease/phosphatase family metal-dependent hydrolase
MALLVRSWNLFHGNTHPPCRRSYLRAMVELAVGDRPDVVCLQEVPVWALPHLAAWSGFQVFPAVARSGLRPHALAGWVTRLNNGLLRSAVTGQANAILVAREHRPVDLGHVPVSQRGDERRVAQAVRVGDVVVANIHASSIDARPELARAELEHTREFVERVADGAPAVIVGDFNLVAHTFDGYSIPGPGIDHVVARGIPCSPLDIWPVDRRMHNGHVLSDHAPVEARVG